MWIASKLPLWKVMKRANFVIVQWYINLVAMVNSLHVRISQNVKIQNLLR